MRAAGAQAEWVNAEIVCELRAERRKGRTALRGIRNSGTFLEIVLRVVF